MLFVFDIDGTLFIYGKDKPYLPSSVKLAFDLIKQQGHKVIFATGRAFFETEMFMEELGVSDAVLSDGAVIIEDGKIIYEETIDSRIAKEFISKVESNSLAALGSNSYHRFVLNSHNLDHHIDIVNTYVNNSVEKEQFKFLDESEAYTVLSCFEDYPYELSGDVKVTKWPAGISISPKGVSKASGINKYIAMHRILKEDVYVFGDNYNDISMFEEFYNNSYVVKDSSEEVKSFAKHELESLEDDGIYKAVLKILRGGNI